jgi:4-amino-4-deoxy-L-arabinose transferase-like glycosyltransferase
VGVRSRRLLVAVVAAGFAVRLGWALAFTSEPRLVQSGDAFFYDYYALQMAEGAGYLDFFTGEATAYYPVGYPALLAVVYLVVDDVLAGTLLNVAAGTAAVALAFVIARRIIGIGGALVAAALVALHPNLVFYVASLQLETVFTAMFLGCVAMLALRDWQRGPPGPTWLVGVGVAIGATTLVRPFVLPLLAVLFVAHVTAGHGWRRAASSTAIATAVVLVVLLPWALRNSARFEHPVLLSTNVGDTLCMDRWSGATGGFAWAAHDGCAPPGLPEDERNTENLRRAVRFVLREPGHEAVLVGKRAVATMRSDHDGLDHVESTGRDLGAWRRPLAAVADAWFFLVCAAAAVGTIRLVRARDPSRLVVVLAAASLLVLPLGLWGTPRFHVPALPLLAVLAAAALTIGGRRSASVS